MSLELRRRQFLAAGLGLGGAAALPERLLAATLGRGFTHAVASGEPGAAGVLLWTRYAAGGDTELAVEVAEDPEFGRIAARGAATARAEADFCARTRIEGLEPDRWYFYRFRAPAGDVSPVGRTRTLPAAGTAPFRMAVFSCSNLPFGFFNAYAHATARRDIDLAVHLGDYIYEYPVGTYPSAEEAVAGRRLDPAHEALRLEDYRRRYRAYRADPDLMRLHQLYPMIAAWDDHEIADDAWTGGAKNHQPDEGSWNARKAAAKQAYRNWMPVGDEPYAAYEIGDLATLIRLDTRLSGRDEQIDAARFLGGASTEAGVAALTDEWVRADRTMLGAAQEAWLEGALARSKAAGKRWQVLAQQVVMGRMLTPPAVSEWVDAGAPDFVRARVEASLALAAAGIPANLDAWGGYPAARRRLLESAQRHGSDLLALAGDSHNSWAFDLVEGGRPAGVEFGVQSVTSPGFERYFRRTPPRDVAAALVESSPELRWAETAGRGYAHVTLGAEEAVCEWAYLETVRRHSAALSGTHRMAVRHGARRLRDP